MQYLIYQNNLKVQFIETILTLLEKHEWNEDLIKKAEKLCNFKNGFIELIFPQGTSEMVDFMELELDNKMFSMLNHNNGNNSTTAKISLALKIRIKNCVSKNVLKNNVYYYAMNGFQATKNVWQTCNKIWYYTGDTSLDWNYYTKRSILSSIYISSILYYLQDQSENNRNTDDFINYALNQTTQLIKNYRNLIKIPKIANIPIIRLFL